MSGRLRLRRRAAWEGTLLAGLEVAREGVSPWCRTQRSCWAT
jgi:hypothetical protein